MKNIIDFLPLYMGSNVAIYTGLVTINPGNLNSLVNVAINGDDMEMHLFPLASITDEEAEDLEKYLPDFEGKDQGMEDEKAIVPMAEFINELRHRHYDCDGLIEAGIAINAKLI